MSAVTDFLADAFSSMEEEDLSFVAFDVILFQDADGVVQPSAYRVDSSFNLDEVLCEYFEEHAHVVHNINYELHRNNALSNMTFLKWLELNKYITELSCRIVSTHNEAGIIKPSVEG